MKEIDLHAGCDIDRACGILTAASEKHQEETYGLFNGKTINSTMSLDECYELITGYTKDKFDEMCRQKAEEDARKKEEFKATIPELVEKYSEIGKKFFEGELLAYWIKILPIRFNDMYQGMEIGCTIEILEALEDYEEVTEECLETVNGLLYLQGHSGMSYGLMKSILRKFNKFGTDLTSKLD